MTSLPSPKQLERMIAQAMEDNDPPMYRSLKRSGSLQAAIKQRATMYETMMERASSRSTTKWTAESNPASHAERVAGMEADLRESNEVALAVVTEFTPGER